MWICTHPTPTASLFFFFKFYLTPFYFIRVYQHRLPEVGSFKIESILAFFQANRSSSQNQIMEGRLCSARSVLTATQTVKTRTRGVMVTAVGNGHGDMNETDCILHNTNTLGKGMNLIILPPVNSRAD